MHAIAEMETAPAPELDLAPARAVLAGLDAAALAARTHRITLGQLVVLHHIATAEAPPSMSDLAVAFGCCTANVTTIVDRMAKLALARRIDTSDRRVKRVIATGKGIDLIESITDTLAVLLAMETE